jgi:hypothetical protein
MSFYWQQRRKIYGEWRFDSWPKVTRWRLRLRDERRSRSFDQIPIFADDIKGKVAALDFFVMLKNSCFSTESNGASRSWPALPRRLKSRVYPGR